jgi:hypothetical protein
MVIFVTLVLPLGQGGAVGLKTATTSSPAQRSSALNSTSAGTVDTGIAAVVNTSSNGGAVPVGVSVSSPTLVANSGGNLYSVNVGVEVGSATSASAELRAHSQFNGGTCGYDGSYAVHLCVTMYYNIKNDSNYYFADDVQVSGNATNEDPSDVVLHDLNLQAGGYGPACNGSGFLEPPTVPENWDIGVPTSGTTYNRYPSWAGNYYRLESGYSDVQNTNLTLKWYYRGNLQTTEMSYQLPDSNSGWPLNGGCSN